MATNRRLIGTAVLSAAAIATVTGAASSCEAPAGASAGVVKPLSKSQRAKLDLSAEQADNAAAVVKVAQKKGVGRRGAIIGIATTLQESNLRTNAVGDGGRAVGIFQQHPHWGSNRTDPYASAERFFSRLKKVRDWKYLPLTVAAQSVQRSAFPNAYAKHERRAEKIVDALWT